MQSSIIAAAIALSVGGSAAAYFVAVRQPHAVEWYKTHTPERVQQLAACRQYQSASCDNAGVAHIQNQFRDYAKSARTAR